MKTGILSLILSLSTFLTFAQPKQSPNSNTVKTTLKPGMILDYEVSANGQAMPLLLNIATLSESEITFDFDFMGGTTGKFVNSKINLEKGNTFNWDQPVAGEERRMPDDQTIGMVSRPFLKDLLTKKKATYDGMEFIMKSVPKGEEILIGGKMLDAVFAETESGATRLWILNNEKYPIILKITGTSSGIEMTLKNIK